jgi:hypothetical protein
VTEMDIVQLIYRPNEPQGALKDFANKLRLVVPNNRKHFQFGRSTMEERWQQRLSDARTTLRASPWGCGKRIVPSWSDAVKWPAFSNESPAKGGLAMKRKAKLPFDPKVFLSKVNGGRAIADYRKDQNVYTQGDSADDERNGLYDCDASSTLQHL